VQDSKNLRCSLCFRQAVRSIYYADKKTKIRALFCPSCGQLETEQGIRIWRGRVKRNEKRERILG